MSMRAHCSHYIGNYLRHSFLYNQPITIKDEQTQTVNLIAGYMSKMYMHLRFWLSNSNFKMSNTTVNYIGTTRIA